MRPSAAARAGCGGRSCRGRARRGRSRSVAICSAGPWRILGRSLLPNPVRPDPPKLRKFTAGDSAMNTCPPTEYPPAHRPPALPLPRRSRGGERPPAACRAALDWPAVPMARPWVQAVRANPAPFWAMESLLREYPISQRRRPGADAPGRSPAARARCRNRHRADRRPAGPRRLRPALPKGPHKLLAQPVGQRHRPVQALPARRAEASPA
jgi:hypothetical protein